MLHPLILQSFAEELVKIAAKLQMEGGHAEIDKAIRMIRSLPQDSEKLIKRLQTEVRKTKKRPAMGGYVNIAIPKKILPKGDLKELGFKKTRLHTRYPGESLKSVSYRRGRLHMHDYPGPVYLMHEDKHAPKGMKQTISHLMQEGLPSLKWFDKSPEARPVKVHLTQEK